MPIKIKIKMALGRAEVNRGLHKALKVVNCANELGRYVTVALDDRHLISWHNLIDDRVVIKAEIDELFKEINETRKETKKGYG